MKAILTVALAVVLCAQLCQVSGHGVPKEATVPVTSSTTAKPWTQRFKDGLGKFLQGAAIAGAVQQGFQNARSGGKYKSHSPIAGPKH